MIRRFLFAAILLLITTSAFAQTPLFTVYSPVQVSNLSTTFTQVGVRCSLRGLHPVTGLEAEFTYLAQWYPMSGGAYSGTPTFVFTSANLTNPGMTDPAYVTKAVCSLMFPAADGGMYQPSATSTGLMAHDPSQPYVFTTVRLIP
jgi:hypothetical protein